MVAYAGFWGPEAIFWSTSGTPARDSAVTVLDSGTLLPAILYTNELKTVQVVNPTFTDERGNLGFFADPGEYLLLMAGALEYLRVVVGIHPDDPSSGGGGGGGVTDHGALTGLGDDDHAQYHTDARGDARYYGKSTVDAALLVKAPIASPTFTGTVGGVTKSHVGLGNVDNTSDAGKPVSSSQQTALDAKAPLASPTLTGTLTVPRVITPPANLADAVTVATDAALGNHFRVILGGNRTLGNPTNPTDGQKVVWEIIQDGTGNRTLALGSTFALGTDVSSVTLSTAAGKRDFIGAVYNAAAVKWYVLAFSKGY